MEQIVKSTLTNVLWKKAFVIMEHVQMESILINVNVLMGSMEQIANTISMNVKTILVKIMQNVLMGSTTFLVNVHLVGKESFVKST